MAWNLWLAEPDLEAARRVAARVRGPHLRALGLAVGPRVQVSMNLIAPEVIGPAEAWDLVTRHVAVAGAELVGLVPAWLLERRTSAGGRSWTSTRSGPSRPVWPGPGWAGRDGRRQALAVAAAAFRARARWRRMRRRSRSLMPPQMPNLSEFSSAY